MDPGRPPVPPPGPPPGLAARNRRTALALIGWIIVLVAVSIAVIWVRN
jgi:hypothetical protein